MMRHPVLAFLFLSLPHKAFAGIETARVHSVASGGLGVYADCDDQDLSLHLLQTKARHLKAQFSTTAYEKIEDESERMCQLVNSRGLLFSCDVHPVYRSQSGVPSLGLLHHETEMRFEIQSKSASLAELGMAHYLQGIETHGDEAVVYVVTTALPPFIEQILPHVTGKIKLVTGDCDKGPIAILGKQAFDALVNNERVMKWWGQDASDGEESNPKFVQLPIGMNYYSLKARATAWGPQASPQEQEAMLLAKSKAAPSFANRSKKLFYSGHPRRLRNEITSSLTRQKTLVDVAAAYSQRSAFWERCGLHRFVASPPGHGIDCHRTWEAIALGSIPVVSHHLQSLYERNGLNVVMLSAEEWGDLDGVTVRRKMAAAAAKHEASLPEAMYLKWWVDKIRGKRSA